METDIQTAMDYFTKFLNSQHVRQERRGMSMSDGVMLTLNKNGRQIFTVSTSKGKPSRLKFGDQVFNLTDEQFTSLMDQYNSQFPINTPTDLDQYL